MRTILGVRKFFEVSGHLRHPDKLGGSTTRWSAYAGLGAYDGVPAPASQLEYWMPELMQVRCPVARVNTSQMRVAPSDARTKTTALSSRMLQLRKESLFI